MAICHLRTSVGSAARGQSATAKHDYITREGKYGRDADEVEHVEHGNMPEWASEDGRGYWQAADAGERANGRLFVEVQIALPNELDRTQQRDLARAFARQLTEGESLPYTVAVHRGESKDPSKPDNPHAHIVLSERSNDGLARTAETWFRRANRQQPERGGAAKVSHLQAREWPERIRQGWSGECNRALERAGREERIDPRTLAEQARAALKNGDVEQAAELARTPEPKRGAGDAIQRRYEQGQAPEPSWAVAAWERTLAENEQWRKECRKRSQKVRRAEAALAFAERLVPVSEEERAVGQVIGQAINQGRALAKRRSGEEQEQKPLETAAPPKRRWWSRRGKSSRSSYQAFTQEVATRVAKQVEEGKAPWQKGYNKASDADLQPFNPTTGKCFKGLNAIQLKSVAQEKGYNDPRWMSYQAANRVGTKVRKGERGTRVEYLRFPPKAQASPRKDAQGKAAASGAAGGDKQQQQTQAISHHTYVVFNAEQIERMPSLEQQLPKEPQQHKICERAERMIQDSGVKIENPPPDGHSYTKYDKDRDTVVIPGIEKFKSPENYYGQAVKQMAGRAAGEQHKDRPEPQSEAQQRDATARQDMRREMATDTICSKLHLPKQPTGDRHKAQWAENIRKNPNELRYAARDADRMADQVLQHDRPQQRSQTEPSRESSIAQVTPERVQQTQRALEQQQQQPERETGFGR